MASKIFFDVSVGGKKAGRLVFEVWAEMFFCWSGYDMYFVELFIKIRGDVVPKTAENFKTLCVGSSEDKNMCYKWSKNNLTLKTFGRILNRLSHIVA